MLKRLLNTLCALLLLSTVALQAQTTVSGVIMDAELNEPLIGANIIIVGTTIGASTDLDGAYSITSDQPLPWTVEVSYTGFAPKTMTVAGANPALNIKLESSAILGQEVVISASRKREKVQEAPASITVIGARKLVATPNIDAARSLINAPGVQIMQQSAARINVELRGGSGLFGTGTFPIQDYRSLVGPGLGTFDVLNSPLNNIDIARIEVVRGPGSALYGPGVTTGVVHFITKNPIDHPGTTVELMGGELNTLGISARHATKVSDKFGFKINAHYKKGDEFTLDGTEGTTNGAGVFTSQLDKFSRTVSEPAITNGVVDVTKPGKVLLTQDQLDPDGDGNMMQNDWFNYAANATLEFRPADDLSVFVSGGVNQASAVFYNSQGEGLSQATEFWGQTRMQKGGLFAQVFYVNNNGGSDKNPTFLYQTGNSTPVARQQLEGQLQYNFGLPAFLDADFTIGMDYRSAVNDTKSLVYGRNEQDDDYRIFGTYLQGKFALGSKLDLVLAGRFDTFNFLGENSFSPRAALVYKASPKHTFRASYNESAGPPSTLQVNIDFPVASPVPGLFDVWLYGQKTSQTWNNPTIDVTLPGVPDLPANTPGLPLAIPYGAVAGQVLPAVYAGLAANPAAAPLVPAIQAFFESYVPGGTTGNFFRYNIFNGQPMPDLVPTAPARLSKTTTLEVGYKGLLGDKLGASVDFYQVTTKGFTQFTAVGPTVALVGSDVAGDLSSQVGADLTPYLTGVLTGLGLPADQVAGTVGALVPLIAGGFAQGGAGFDAAASPLYGIFGAIESDQVPTGDGIVHSTAGYRSFSDAERDRLGLDIGLEYFVNNNVSIFGNYSWVDQTEWIPGQDDDDGLPFSSFLNIPKNKFRLGFNLTPEYGFRANVAFQHDDAFLVDAGQFSGMAEKKNLVDAGVGYRFENGVSVDLTATNLFDNEYRALPNMPLIGRRVLGKVTFDFGGEGRADADGDGVPDSKDNCPNSAGLKAFGGCPDSDGDGIIDSADGCPLAAGPAGSQGCPDSDGDGVLDKDDACADVSGTVNGCPDADGDGVADGNDKCPNAAGPLNGCPDADGDGVADGDDACPNAAGPINGCPDGDGDGVADNVDKCPGVAGDGADGCPSDPDSDGDGVVDSKDACPNAAGNLNGCPDGDADGIADKDDKCPTLGGNVTADGCPVVPTRVTEVFNRALQGIQFETGSNRIRSASRAVLGEIITIIKDNPTYLLNIGGHTDSVGSSESNERLSQRRADSVKKYLMDRGIDGNRVIAVGYGESNPVADNKYAAGRKQNRRVELSVNYRQ